MGKTNNIGCEAVAGRTGVHDDITPGRFRHSRAAAAMGLSLAVLAGFVLLFYFDRVTAVFVLFVGMMTLHGYLIGATKSAAIVGGMVTGALFCVPLGVAVEDHYPNIFPLTGVFSRLVAIGLSALAVAALTYFALRHVLYRMVHSRPQWWRYDPWIGSGMGVIEGVLLGLVLLWTMTMLEPIAASSLTHHKPLGNSTPDRSISQQFIDFTQTARGSAVGWLAETFNPLDEIRQVALLADGIVVLSDPEARTAFTNHPTIQDIQHYPSVKQALEMLAADPGVVRTLETGSAAEVVQAVMTSPTLLDIFDQTSILEDLTPLADDIEQAIEAAIEHKNK